MGIVVLIAASVLQVGYHALILLWIMFVSPLVRLMTALAHVAVAAVEQAGAGLNP